MRNPKIHIVILVVIAILSGAFWSMKVWGSSETRGDDVIYKGVALDLMQKGQYTFEGGPTNVEPFYPFFLAGILGVFGINHDVVRVVQIIILAVSIILFFLIARHVVGLYTAFGSAILAALFYGLASPTGFLHRETLLIFLLLADVYYLYVAQTKNYLWAYGIAGILSGLLLLTNTSFQYFPIFVAGNIWLIHRKNLPFANIFKKIAVFLIAVVIVILPWLTYRYYVLGDFSVASRKGMLLLRKVETAERLTKNPLENLIGYGLGYYIAEQFQSDITKRAFSGADVIENREADLIKQGYTYAQTDKLFTAEAISRITSAPHKYLYVILINFIHLNNSFIPDKDDWSNSQTILLFAEGRHAGIPAVLKLGILLSIRLVWLAFLGIIIYSISHKYKEWQKWGWVLLPVFYVNIIYSLIHGIPRFSLPIYPFYILLFAVGGSIIVKKYFKNLGALPN